MIIYTLEQTCIILAAGIITTQPALRAPELTILRALLAQPNHRSLFQLAAYCGLAYNSAYAAVYSLRTRGMINVKKNGVGLVVTPIAERLIED